MALAGTHIRFALDLAERLHIQDVKPYILGTLYPDSRYVSGTDRRLTHPKNFFPKRALSDFENGWAVHILCDHIQGEVFGKLFPDLFPQGLSLEDWWPVISVLKVLQDTDDIARVDVMPFIVSLDTAYNPVGEDIEKVREYNEIIQRVYRTRQKGKGIDAIEMWRQVGVNPERLDKIRGVLNAYSSAPEILSRIPQVYPEMIRRVNNELQ